MALQWRLSEDALLMRAVKKYGFLNWKSVSASVGTRSASECKYRWYQCLDPRFKMCDWTPEEDRELESLHVKLPNKWASISDAFKGSRTASQCQIRHQHLFPPAMHVPPMFNPLDAVVGQSPDVSPELVEPYPDLDLKKKKPILVVESKSKSESALYRLTTLCRNVKVVDHQSKASSSTKVDPKLGKKRRIDDVKQPLLHSPEPEPEPGLKEIGIFGSTRMEPSEMRLVETLTRGLLSEGFHIVTVSRENGTCKAVKRGSAKAHTVLPHERDVVARVQRLVAFAYRNSTAVLEACANAKSEGKEAVVFFLD